MRSTWLIVFVTISFYAHAQGDTSSALLSGKQLHSYLGVVSKKYSDIQAAMLKTSQKYIDQLRKREQRIYRKLRKKDSAAASRLAEAAEHFYDQAALDIQVQDTTPDKRLKEYLPQFDSVKTSIAFLDKTLKGSSDEHVQLNAAKRTLQQFEQKMQVGNELKRRLQERRDALAAELEQYGMVKELKGVSKAIYYYQEQLKAYKAILNDPKKIEQKAIAVLRNSQPFKDFMKKHSMLAQLFRVPENYGSAESLAGLQTRSGVEALLTQRMAGAGVNPREYMQGQMNQAQGELNKVKKRLTPSPSPRGEGSRASSSDIDMPDNFKPNTQKTKSFFKRLEYGTSFQTQRSDGYFPVTTDVALTLGYKLNDKSVIGVGASYKMGWGSGIENIKLTHEGVGLRSYADVKLKGSLWITGGYEQNYYQRFSDLRQISNIDVWRQSALLGITKKVKMRKKESKVQLLYDFLHKQNNIHTQPLVFRIGYSF